MMEVLIWVTVIPIIAVCLCVFGYVMSKAIVLGIMRGKEIHDQSKEVK